MAPPNLDIGKLLRVRGMALNAAQIEATHNAVGALCRAYNGLCREMTFEILGEESVSGLRSEFVRLFPEIAEPQSPQGDAYRKAAIEAHLGLGRLQGWVQGLIDELTLETRLRLDAEAQANKPPVGFGT